MAYVVTVLFEIHAAHVNAFLTAMKNQARNSLEREPDCLQFDVCIDPDNPNHIFLYEIYQSAEAFQQHLDSDHFLAFDQAVRDWVVRKEVSTWLR